MKHPFSTFLIVTGALFVGLMFWPAGMTALGYTVLYVLPILIFSALMALRDI